jgi:hypothetical protein
MVKLYTLINPFIKGKFETSVEAKNSQEAASILYKNLADHFSKELPNFYFSLAKDKKYYHFEVNEKKNKNEVTFSINALDLNNNTEEMKNFTAKLNTIKKKLEEPYHTDPDDTDSQQKGGKKKKTIKKYSKNKKKKHHDSDSDSDSSSEEKDVYVKTKKYYVNDPIYYYYWDPYIYNAVDLYWPSWYPWAAPYYSIVAKYGT